MILHWKSMKSMIFWCSGLWWPFLAFIGLFGLCGLGWFFKAKTGLCWWKLSTIDLFPKIRCQNQSPNEIGHFESVWRMSKGAQIQTSFDTSKTKMTMYCIGFSVRQSIINRINVSGIVILFIYLVANPVHLHNNNIQYTPEKCFHELCISLASPTRTNYKDWFSYSRLFQPFAKKRIQTQTQFGWNAQVSVINYIKAGI